MAESNSGWSVPEWSLLGGSVAAVLLAVACGGLTWHEWQDGHDDNGIHNGWWQNADNHEGDGSGGTTTTTTGSTDTTTSTTGGVPSDDKSSWFDGNAAREADRTDVRHEYYAETHP